MEEIITCQQCKKEDDSFYKRIFTDERPDIIVCIDCYDPNIHGRAST